MATLKGYLALLRYAQYLGKLQLDSAVWEFKDYTTVVDTETFTLTDLELVYSSDEEL